MGKKKRKRELDEIKIIQLFCELNSNKIRLKKSDPIFRNIAQRLKIPHETVFKIVRPYQPYVKLRERRNKTPDSQKHKSDSKRSPAIKAKKFSDIDYDGFPDVVQSVLLTAESYVSHTETINRSSSSSIDVGEKIKALKAKYNIDDYSPVTSCSENEEDILLDLRGQRKRKTEEDAIPIDNPIHTDMYELCMSPSGDQFETMPNPILSELEPNVVLDEKIENGGAHDALGSQSRNNSNVSLSSVNKEKVLCESSPENCSSSKLTNTAKKKGKSKFNKELMCDSESELIEFRKKLKVGTPDIIFHVTIKVKKILFKEVFRTRTYQDRRTRTVLQSGWSSKLSALVWDKIRIPCCLKWKTGNIRANDIICKGECAASECKMQIECIAARKRLSFKIEYFDASYLHDVQVKRRLLSVDVPKYRELLRGKSAFGVQCTMADALLNESDIEMEPSVLPKTKALRNIKYKEDAPKEKPIFALLTLKKQYPGAISYIGLDPFAIMYSTKLQKIYYKGERSRKRTTISIDATGLGLRPPVKDQPTTSPIFFYAITCHGLPRSFPVAQMLSQMHNIKWIRLWLQTWLENNSLPDEVVIDESAALMGAVVTAFTQFETTNDYLNACTESLLHDTELPRIFLRIDRSHFVKSIMRNVRKGFQHTIGLIRGILGYLITCKNFRAAGKIIHALFSVIFNEYESPTVRIHSDMLVNLVRTHKTDIFDQFSDEVEYETNEGEIVEETDKRKINDKSLKKTSSYHWIEGILASVKVFEATENINKYFAPSYKKYLMSTLARLPLWSNIMMEKFSSTDTCATSTPSENTFKEMKVLLDLTKKRRVDVFVRKDLERLSGHLKLGVSNQKYILQKSATKRRSASTDQPIQRKGSRPKHIDYTHSCDEYSSDESAPAVFNVVRSEKSPESPVENWRNKNKMKSQPVIVQNDKRRSQKSILMKHDPFYSRNGILTLKNGFESSKLSTINTCSFDSIYVIFGIACLDYQSAAEIYLNTGTLFSDFLQGIVSGKKKSSNRLYRLRNRILHEVFSSEYYNPLKNNDNSNNDSDEPKNILFDGGYSKLIDCRTGLGGFFSQLTLQIENKLTSYVLIRECPCCNNVKETQCPLIPLRLSQTVPISLSNIQEKNSMQERSIRCNHCKSELLSTHRLSDIIAFEVEPTSIQNSSLHKIENIQSEIHLEGKAFTLFGVIEFIPKLQHFVSYVQRGDGVWEKYDDLNYVYENKQFTKTEMNVFMVFYKCAEIN